MSPQTGLDTLHPAQTPEGIAFSLRPAGPWVRMCAFFIDSLIGGFVFVLASALLVYAANITGSWLYLLLSFVYTWFYHTLFEVFSEGMSPGKRLLGLRVVMSDGSPVEPGSSFLRNLLRFGDTFMYLHHIALLAMSLSPGFRRLGDWVAGTMVVYTEIGATPLTRTSMPWLVPFTQRMPIPPLSQEERQTLLNFARRFPVLGMDRARELASLYAPSLRSRLNDNASSCPDDAQLLLAAAAAILGMST
ncbi:MAG: RDD family protein [Spirochaetales bacterium]|nr:RDD family protein [Spirochaetales bacterium]